MDEQILFDGLHLNEHQKLLWIKNALIQKNPNLKVLKPKLAGMYSPLIELLGIEINNNLESGKLFLPNLQVWDNKSVAIFSDYSGESSGKYYTYSFLVCAMDALGYFRQKMSILRKDLAFGNKELAFKDLGMGSMQKILPEYLSLLDQYVPGLLLTVVIDKKLTSVIGHSRRDTLNEIAKILEDAGFGKLKLLIAEKMVRIVSISALLVGLLGKSGQKIFWMTDHDAICENNKHNNMLAFFQRAIGIYSNANFPLIGGARPFEEKSTDYLDLLSAADLVAGSLAHYFTLRDTKGNEDIMVKDGVEKILYWLGGQGLSLQKLNIIITPGQNGIIHSGTIDITQKLDPNL